MTKQTISWTSERGTRVIISANKLGVNIRQDVGGDWQMVSLSLADARIIRDLVEAFEHGCFQASESKPERWPFRVIDGRKN